MLITGSPGSSVSNIIHVYYNSLHDGYYEHRVLYPRRPLLMLPTPTRHGWWCDHGFSDSMPLLEILVFCLLLLDSWLFVTIRAEKRWVLLLYPYCISWAITAS